MPVTSTVAYFRHPINVTQPAHDRAALRVVHSAEQMLPPEVVEEIYAAAAAPPPLSEPPSVAKMFADLYRHARTEAGAVMTIATVATAPVGFAYGHNWRWDRATDPWSTELRNRLGEQVGPRIHEADSSERRNTMRGGRPLVGSGD